MKIVTIKDTRYGSKMDCPQSPGGRMKKAHVRCRKKIQKLEARIESLESVLKHVCHMSDMTVRIRQFVERSIGPQEESTPDEFNKTFRDNIWEIVI